MLTPCGLEGALGTHGTAVPVPYPPDTQPSQWWAVYDRQRFIAFKSQWEFPGAEAKSCLQKTRQMWRTAALVQLYPMGMRLPSVVLSQQSAPRQGLCLDPDCEQTPSHLMEAAPSRRNCICDRRATACLSLFAWPKKTPTPKNLAGKLGTTYCRKGMQCAPPGCKCSTSGKCLQPRVMSCWNVNLNLQYFKGSRAVKLHLWFTSWKLKIKPQTKPHQTPKKLI